MSGPRSSWPVGGRRCLPDGRTGYDATMSESSSENDQSTDGSQGITDDQLPDDLNPEENPLARDPEDTDESGGSAGGTDEVS